MLIRRMRVVYSRMVFLVYLHFQWSPVSCLCQRHQCLPLSTCTCVPSPLTEVLMKKETSLLKTYYSPESVNQFTLIIYHREWRKQEQGVLFYIKYNPPLFIDLLPICLPTGILTLYPSFISFLPCTCLAPYTNINFRLFVHPPLNYIPPPNVWYIKSTFINRLTYLHA